MSALNINKWFQLQVMVKIMKRELIWRRNKLTSFLPMKS
ncbi:hypothetical protein EDF81_1456 [Enterobacter sp. BIGb0383]|nr:hypothetical protein EDF81_1456 [Enterobacter sp. BIGb0383]ROS13104.1 hypothetical protein EC848_1458 [Enterobacter sp. BIGb0359]